MSEMWRGSVVEAFALAAGAAGASEVFVPGGKDLAVTNLARTPVPANSLCIVQCEAKRLGPGCVLFGTSNVNCDDNSSWTDWKHETVVFRTPAGVDGQCARFGTYNAASGACFRAVSVSPVTAEYSACGGLVLGHGESVVGNVYTFSAQFGSVGRTDSRPLLHWRGAFFNTHRICMSKNSEIVYRHALDGRRLLSGDLTVGAIHRGGSFGIEVSADGADWTSLHVMTNATSVSLRVPGSFFPARELFVRLRGIEGSGLQFNSYSLRSTVDGAPVFAAGSTRYRAADGTVVAECSPPALYADGYGELVSETGGMSLWRASSGWKVARRRSVPSARAKGVVVRAAANEAESVQLVVTPRAGLADVRVACGDLRMAGTGAGKTTGASWRFARWR